MMYLILVTQLVLFAVLIRTRHARVNTYRAKKYAQSNGALPFVRFTPSHGVKHVSQ